jgi:hypothetical protein
VIPRWLPFVIFALFTAIFFSSQLFGGTYFWNDFSEYVYPMRVFASSHISAGELPFWNPYSFSGTPFLADPQTGVFYIPYLVLDALSNSANYSIWGLQFVIIAHFFVAQVAMYLMCRRLQCTMLSSVLAGVGYGFSSSLSLHTFHPMSVYHLAWFPLIFRFFHEAVVDRSLKASIIFGLLLGITLLSGSPQFSLFILLFLGCWAAYYVIASLRAKEITRSQAVSPVLLAVLCVVITLGIFAVQYLPTREFAELSERSGMNFEKASVGSLQFKQLLTFAVPKAFGSEVAPSQETGKEMFFLDPDQPYLYWDTAFYFGIATLILAIIGARANWKQRETRFFVAMALFAFLFALGSNGFLYRLFFQLPLFSSLRAPARMMFFVSFGCSILAAFGFDHIVRVSRSGEKADWRYILQGAAVPLLMALAVAIGLFVNAPAEFMTAVRNSAITSLCIALAAIAVCYALHQKMIKPVAAAMLLAVMVFGDLYSANSSFSANAASPALPYEQYLTPELRTTLTAQPPQNIFRVAARKQLPQGTVNGLVRNQGLIDRIMMFEGYNTLLIANRFPITEPRDIMRDMLGIKYEVDIDTTDPTNAAAIFRKRTTAYPHAWMVFDARQAPHDQVQRAMQESIDFRRTAFVEAPLSAPISISTPATNTVQCRSYTDNSITYQVNTAAPGLLCLSEIWYPAWTAYVDDKPFTIHRTNMALRGIEIPAGNHRVELRYESASFATGRMITLATLALSIMGLGYVALRSRRTP